MNVKNEDKTTKIPVDKFFLEKVLKVIEVLQKDNIEFKKFKEQVEADIVKAQKDAAVVAARSESYTEETPNWHVHGFGTNLTEYITRKFSVQFGSGFTREQLDAHGRQLEIALQGVLENYGVKKVTIIDVERIQKNV